MIITTGLLKIRVIPLLPTITVVPYQSSIIDAGDAPRHRPVKHPGFNKKEAERQRRENEKLDRYIQKLYYSLKGLPLPKELLEELENTEEIVELTQEQKLLIRSRVFNEDAQNQLLALYKLQQATHEKLQQLVERYNFLIEQENERRIAILLQQLL